MADKAILVVTSKLKNHIKSEFDMSTSSKVPEKLTDIIAQLVDRAAKQAQKDHRKTVMDRDFDFLDGLLSQQQ